MPWTSFRILRATAAAAAFAAFVPVAAQAGERAPAADTPPSPFAEAALSDRELGGARGTAGMTTMGDVGVNIAEQSAQIGNNAINATTKTGEISDNAVSALGGISMFNLNSGNFNSFQNIFQLNIQLGQ